MAQSISQEAIGATGLPGATAASRYAGATASGAPVSGTFAVGDYVVDQSGAMWVCISAGTPGTWTKLITGTNPVFTGAYETVSVSSTVLNGSTPASLAASTASLYLYTANPTASFTVNLTNVPTTTGQAVTFALGVVNGSSAYLPLNITINGTQAGASSSALPLEKATNNNITTYYQSGTAWSAADVSTLNYYTITCICTGSSAWTMLLAQTKF